MIHIMQYTYVTDCSVLDLVVFLSFYNKDIEMKTSQSGSQG